MTDKEFNKVVEEVEKIRKNLVGTVQSDLKELGTYKTRKGGIDSKTWERVMERPDNVSIDSLLKIKAKIKVSRKRWNM